MYRTLTQKLIKFLRSCTSEIEISLHRFSVEILYCTSKAGGFWAVWGLPRGSR